MIRYLHAFFTKVCEPLLAVAVIGSLLAGFGWPQLAHATPGTLDLTRDTVYNYTPGATQVPHDIYFALPVTATQITPSDWILIDMPNYTAITAPSSVIGSYGDPTYKIVGTQVRISNVAILPGSGINIVGITATNPALNQSTELQIRIAQDEAGTIVRNQALLVPTDSKSVITVSATIQSPLAALSISGHTSVTAFVTLTENSTVMATTLSDGVGNFTFNLTALDVGAHTYQLFASDSSNRSTAQTSLNLYLLANNLTSASGIILSSSLALSTASINPGDPLTIDGAAEPGTQINLFLESPLRTYVANTRASDGEWSYTLASGETSSLSPGQYRVYTIVQDTLGNQSVVSNTLNFDVLAPADNNPAPACNINHGDLNCNGVTNLVDFSILLYHWNTNHRLADINGDGSVNLVDFSIMMFYYTP